MFTYINFSQQKPFPTQCSSLQTVPCSLSCSIQDPSHHPYSSFSHIPRPSYHHILFTLLSKYIPAVLWWSSGQDSALSKYIPNPLLISFIATTLEKATIIFCLCYYDNLLTKVSMLLLHHHNHLPATVLSLYSGYSGLSKGNSGLPLLSFQWLSITSRLKPKIFTMVYNASQNRMLQILL